MLRSEKVATVVNIAKQKELDTGRSMKYWAELDDTYTTTDGQQIRTLKVGASPSHACVLILAFRSSTMPR